MARDEFECDGSTVVITPQHNLGELDYERFETRLANLSDLFEENVIKNVLIDLHCTSYFGSEALGMFIALARSAEARQGRLAFCGMSPHEISVLRTARLDRRWPIYSTREEAMQALAGNAHGE